MWSIMIGVARNGRRGEDPRTKGDEEWCVLFGVILNGINCD